MTTMIGATEAARLLGVTKPTLYAYVSRGLLERRASVDGRTSLYPRDAVERLAARGRTRAAPERPSIDVQIASSITQLSDDRLRFRGHDVGGLAGVVPFESVAELLWTGTLASEPPTWTIDRAVLDRCRDTVRAARPRDPVTALALCAMTLASDTDASGADAARCLLTVAPTVLGGPLRGTVAERLTKAYVKRPTSALVEAVDASLVLLADHELATSTLAVRVACSVRTSAYAAIGAGLAVVGGPLHGGASSEAATMIGRALSNGAASVVAGYLDAGRRLPGFGHSVYRRGDPRVEPLLAPIRRVPGSGPVMEAVDRVIAEAGRRLAHLPNVDLALGALLAVGGFPHDAPLFAVARLAGWGAHHDEELGERPVRFRGLTRLR